MSAARQAERYRLWQQASMANMRLRAPASVIGPAAPPGAHDRDDPNWVMRNKLLFVLFVIVLAILSEPAWASHIPREVREFLHQDEGPAAFCMALVAAVTAAMAVNNSKRR